MEYYKKRFIACMSYLLIVLILAIVFNDIIVEAIKSIDYHMILIFGMLVGIAIFETTRLIIDMRRYSKEIRVIAS